MAQGTERQAVTKERFADMAIEATPSPANASAPAQDAPPRQAVGLDAADAPKAKQRSGLARARDAFLDAIDTPFTALFVRPAQAALETPEYQRREAKNQAAISIANYQKSLHDAKNLYAAEEATNAILSNRNKLELQELEKTRQAEANAERQNNAENRKAQEDARTSLLQSQAAAANENFYNARLAKAISTATTSAMSVVNNIPEFKGLQSDKAREEVLNSEELREFTVFKAMGNIQHEAVQDLIDGKADTEAGRMMEDLAHSVDCSFKIENKEIYLVNNRTGKQHPINEETLKIYEESAIQQIQQKCQKAQSTDPSFCGGFAAGETSMEVCNALVNAGLSIDQAREQVRKYYNVLQASPKEKDMFEMNTALKHVMSAAQGSGKDIFNPNDVASMSSRDQSTLLSIIGTPAQGDMPATGLCKYGVEIRPKQDNSGYVVYDPNHFFSARDSFDARELPAILQREDSFGAMVNREIQSAQEARFLAMSRATANASGRILRGEPSYGEEGDNQEQDKSKLSKEDRKYLMSMAGDTAIEWDDNQFRNYKDMLDALYANAEAAGVTDGERRLVVTEENKDKLKRMAEVERGMIKARKLKGVRPIFEPVVEAIKEKDLAEEGLALYAEMFAEQRRREEEKKQNSKSIRRVVRPISR